MPGASRGSLVVFIGVLLALDAAAVLAVERWAGAPAVGGEGEWAFCQTSFEGREVTPTSVAITYLDSDDAGITAGSVRRWLGDLDPLAVDVYRLEQADGRRRLAFELAGGKWAPWREAAGDARGREVCDRVRAALLARGIGRPASQGGAKDPRQDFELIYARRPHLYRSISWIGTAAHVLEAEAFERELAWLEGLE